MMEPLFFGPADGLFGVYEPPQGRVRDRGVLVCNAGVQEYGRAHFAVRRLASQLARRGFHVLRFDWSGTGDSTGDLEGATVERWCEDLLAAAAELRELSGAHRLCAVGYRLGAAIAARACSERLELRDLVLWDPPLTGAAHLAELRAGDREYRTTMPQVQFGADELLGHLLPAELATSLEALDLRKLAPLRAERVVVLSAAESPSFAAEIAALRDQRGQEPSLLWIPEAITPPGLASVLPTRSLQAIVSELAGGAP